MWVSGHGGNGLTVVLDDLIFALWFILRNVKDRNRLSVCDQINLSQSSFVFFFLLGFEPWIASVQQIPLLLLTF